MPLVRKKEFILWAEILKPVLLIDSAFQHCYRERGKGIGYLVTLVPLPGVFNCSDNLVAKIIHSLDIRTGNLMNSEAAGKITGLRDYIGIDMVLLCRFITAITTSPSL
jgi:hypothetical protein